MVCRLAQEQVEEPAAAAAAAAEEPVQAAVADAEEPVQELVFRPAINHVARAGSVDAFNEHYERMIELGRVLIEAIDHNYQPRVNHISQLLRDVVRAAHGMLQDPRRPVDTPEASTEENPLLPPPPAEVAASTEEEEASDLKDWGDVYNRWRHGDQLWIQTGVGGPSSGYVID